MAISDFLEKVGSGLETGAKAAGAVAQPILQRTAEVVSGEAPQIDQEQRTRQEQMEDAQINAKAQELENQLAMGQKYGTLTPDQQQQYIDQITGLYNKPRHAPMLMERLRKAIHPNGAVAPTPTAALPSATPAGGTAAADEAIKQREENQKLRDALTLVDERGKFQGPKSKSPPLPGSQLPADAVGVDGQPIPEEARTAGRDFVQFNGAWWPVLPKPPVMKYLRGHAVLFQDGKIVRDLGPKDAVKITYRDSLQPGDDQQMHIVRLATVSVPGGANIEVQPDTGEDAGTEGSPSAGGSGAPPSSAPKTPAKKVGSILPKTGAKPASSGTVVPGFSTLAQNKIRNQAQSKADKDVVDAQKLSTLADLVAANPNDAINQKRLAVALERASAGRFTTQALDYVIKAGWGNTLEQWANNATTGALPPDVLRQLVDGAHQNLTAAQKAQDAAYGRNTPAAPAPQPNKGGNLPPGWTP